MKFTNKYRRRVAILFLTLLTAELLLPVTALSLTSGPSQPEMQGFSPIGNTDMVDLFSGDFNYNLPLLDVGGYPVNLSYKGGGGLDEEAGWVGYGWALNVGSVNRQLRGVPDDFNGVDQQEREMNIKDHTVKGGRFSMSLDLLGIPVSKAKGGKKKKKVNMALTVSAGVKLDNYRGIGMELGANAGLSLADDLAGENTAAMKDSSAAKSFGLGNLGLNLSSMEGAGVTYSTSILRKNIEIGDKPYGLSKSIGFGYNSRTGLTGMTLGTSFSTLKSQDAKKELKMHYSSSSSSFITFNGDTYTPTITHPMKSTSYTLSFNAGAEVFFAYLGLGVTGFYSNNKLAEKQMKSPAYGFLHAEMGKNNSHAIMDFNREKDIPYNAQIKYLPIPIPTYDLFVASSQDGSGQYRASRGSAGVFFDPESGSTSNNFSLGVEVGGGAFFDVGADLYFQDINTTTKKWRDRNKFLGKGDFQSGSPLAPLNETAYFKRVGEPLPSDADFLQTIKGKKAVAVQLPAHISNVVSGAEASDKLRTAASRDGESTTVLKRNKREARNTVFSYLNAREASFHGLEKNLIDHHPDSIVIGACSGNEAGIKSVLPREDDQRKAHHISQVTVTGEDGKRTVFGIPVYNNYQEEVSFSVPENLSLRNKGLTKYSDGIDNSVNNKNGKEHYYSKEKTPAYATSYLLTAILSPDYIDKTGNGVSDDDHGTAVKFNYSKLDNIYKWRTPMAAGADTANYNEGFLSDRTDDKASYVYGEKEIWYLHSIESKTMVAHFILGNRKDALGVKNNRGGIDTLNKQKYLKEIRLYSKSDLLLNGNNPSLTVPIKTVHFEYDYSICRGLPNSIDHGGKLTLKKMYFTFGRNGKGRLNAYNFGYDTSYNTYGYRQYDRWGNYKEAGINPGSMNNSEYPYTIQDSATASGYMSAGQLNEIRLPTGGTIHISYESDDYAFVQDKRASVMCSLQGVGAPGSASGLISADYIYVNLPYPVSSRSEMLERYFEGVEFLYYKCFLDLDNLGHNEFVPGYARIQGTPELVGNNVAKVKIEKIGGINAIAKAGWQFLRLSLPGYAYPGSENIDDEGGDLKKMLKALGAAFGSIKELVYGFDARAKKRDYSNNINLSKSWVRLCAPEWKKIGGGGRVRKIDISDAWAEMSGTSGAKTATYTQLFDYTTTDEKGRQISSGVASYEPMLGNDENPFRQPLKYKQNQFLGLDNYYYIEEPFGENLYPAASVGYSKVTVRSIGAGDDPSMNRTGVTVSEFYTAREYPVKVEILSLQDRKPISSRIFKLISGVSYDMVGLSQGYSIELNDMHGKPRSVNIFNKSNQNISSVEYYYKTENELAEKRTLNNSVKLIRPDGSVADGEIGLDVELYTDMREQKTNNLGMSGKASGGSGSVLVFPLPFFFPGIGVNYDQRNFRSSSSIKIVQRFGIQYKIRKVESGSSITTENLLWDAETGNVLLTKTQNEFNDPVYNFSYPAHWMYDGMGQAYKNIGAMFAGFSTGVSGEILHPVYDNCLVPGDELIRLDAPAKYWVISSPVNGVTRKRLVDESGNLVTLSPTTVKLLRSGRRNMAMAGVGSVSSLQNPVVGAHLNITQLTKILNAGAAVYKEEWRMPVAGRSVQDMPGQTCIDPSCLATFFTAAVGSQVPGQSRKSLFAAPLDGQTAGDIMKSYLQHGSPLLNGPCFNNMLNGASADSMPYFLHAQRLVTVGGCSNINQILPGDTATLGKCRIIFDYVNNTAQAIVDYNNNMDIKPEGYTPPCIAPFCGGEGYRVVNNDCGFTVQKVMVVNPLNGDCKYDSVLYEVFRIRTLCTSDTITGCLDPVGGKVNPYAEGLLGNWRVKAQYAYQTSRENVKDAPAVNGNTNIRKAGAYSVFNPFWKNNGTWQVNPSGDARWIAASEVTLFNDKGAELENKDALNRYSSVLFGYLKSLPVAVSSNARFREIAYDGFEDYNFDLPCAASDSCVSGHLDFKKLLNGTTVQLTTQKAHSGKYSLQLNGSAVLRKTVYLGDPPSLLGFSSGMYMLKDNELGKGFSPVPGKQYVLSFWVKDGAPRSPSVQMQVRCNGTDLISSTMHWPVVEGWKRIEVPFLLQEDATSIEFQFNSGPGMVLLDDLRVHPFDAQLKSFAYDASSQRLWAELDENNFATFYEYDDEGVLIRVKKETDRGIMTLKESRSSYKKK
ncbi:MAG: hypothetical protein ACO1NW_18535 [Chitinophagaceae bacterium]